jgi:nitrogen fixation NifU-like protein
MCFSAAQRERKRIFGILGGMFNEKILDHFRTPHNPGELQDASQIVQVTNPVCGDVLKLWVRMGAGRIVAATFKAQGCVPAIAAGSALTDLLVGKTLPEAAQITPQAVSFALGGLPEASFHAAELCGDAIAALKPH